MEATMLRNVLYIDRDRLNAVGPAGLSNRFIRTQDVVAVREDDDTVTIFKDRTGILPRHRIYVETFELAMLFYETMLSDTHRR
jgi:hypothetical protein